MTSARFEQRLRDRAVSVAARAATAAAAERANRLAAAPLPGVKGAEAQSARGAAAILLRGARLRHRYVSDADLRRLIRERLL